MNKERVLWLDFLRVFSLFSMMILHVTTTMWHDLDVSSNEWMYLNIYNSLVRHCVPIFVMVSGAILLNSKYVINIKEIYTVKIMRLFIAFVSWSGVYTVVTMYREDIRGSVNFIKIFTEGQYHLWFLLMMSGIYMMLPIAKAIVSKKEAMEYYIILSIIFFYLPNLLLQMNPFVGKLGNMVLDYVGLEVICGYMSYFVLGYYLITTVLSKNQRIILYLLGILARLFTIIGTQWLSIQSGGPIKALYGNSLITTLITSAAIFVFFQHEVSRININHRVGTALSKLSGLSLGMYLCHDLFNQLLEELGVTVISYSTILAVPFNALLIFIGSGILAYCISKINLVKNISCKCKISGTR